MVKLKNKSLTGFAAAALVAGGMLAANSSAQAETINIRIASGHPPTVVYAGLMKNFFQPELKKAIKGQLSAYKVPKHLYLYSDNSELPFTDSGKIDKRKLADMLSARIESEGDS